MPRLLADSNFSNGPKSVPHEKEKGNIRFLVLAKLRNESGFFLVTTAVFIRLCRVTYGRVIFRSLI